MRGELFIDLAVHALRPKRIQHSRPQRHLAPPFHRGTDNRVCAPNFISENSYAKARLAAPRLGTKANLAKHPCHAPTPPAARDSQPWPPPATSAPRRRGAFCPSRSARRRARDAPYPSSPTPRAPSPPLPCGAALDRASLPPRAARRPTARRSEERRV